MGLTQGAVGALPGFAAGVSGAPGAMGATGVLGAPGAKGVSGAAGVSGLSGGAGASGVRESHRRCTCHGCLWCPDVGVSRVWPVSGVHWVQWVSGVRLVPRLG